jgi:hypothetical protein
MISLVLVIVAMLEILFGLGVFLTSKSAIHEILAVLAFGFGILTFGLAAILRELRLTLVQGTP